MTSFVSLVSLVSLWCYCYICMFFKRRINEMSIAHSFWFSFSPVLPFFSVWLGVGLTGMFPPSGDTYGMLGWWALYGSYLLLAALPFANASLLLRWLRRNCYDTFNSERPVVDARPLSSYVSFNAFMFLVELCISGSGHLPFYGLFVLWGAGLHQHGGYFNAMFLFFGLSYFEVRGDGGIKLTLLADKSWRKGFPPSLVLSRINNRTFYFPG